MLKLELPSIDFIIVTTRREAGDIFGLFVNVLI